MEQVIARWKRLRPKSPPGCALPTLYYRENAFRMKYDEYLRLGYGVGGGAVESAHEQLLLRLLLGNNHWALLDRMARVSLA